MQIVPKVGEQPISASSVTIAVNPDDLTRVRGLVLHTSKILAVTDNDSFVLAKRVAGELKAMVDEITDSRRAAKRPFSAVEKAIDELAHEIGTPVLSEQKRILALLSGYVARLEAIAKEEQRRKDEAVAKQIAEARARVKAAEQAQAKAEEEARRAKDQASRATAQAEAERRQIAAEQAQLVAEMAKEISEIGEQPKRGLVAGGRVDHPYEFRLVDLQACLRAGGWRLLRCALDYRACQDSCRAQLELNPEVEPTLPGIEVSRRISVSVKATARIQS